MSDYQRFISYIYEYHKNRKGENRGYIRLEAKGKFCRLDLRLKGICRDGDTQVDVYAFCRNGERLTGSLLGSYSAHSGILQQQIEYPRDQMGDHSYSLADIRGILIQDSCDGVYATGWDDELLLVDAFIHEPSGPSQSNSDAAKNISDSSQPHNSTPDISHDDSHFNNNHHNASSNIPGNASDNITANTPGNIPANTPGNIPDNTPGNISANTPGNIPDNTPDNISANTTGNISDNTPGNIPDNTPGNIPGNAPDIIPDNAPGNIPDNTPDNISANTPDNISANVPDNISANASGQVHATSTEDEVTPFKDGEIIRCRRITLEDIIFLHPQDQHLNNNRFVHYGQQMFGHLLVGELADTGQFVLCVPGTYHQQECFMANMFGFSHFKRCPVPGKHPKCFGYWYRLIHAPNFHPGNRPSK